MPEQVRCPECDAALRVPDNLLGKKVKCPKCQTAFVAELDEPAPPQGIVREPAPSSRRSRVPEEIEDDEEEFPPEDEAEERPRGRKKKRRRSLSVESAVSGPATALLVVGILDIVIGVMNLLLGVLGVSLMTIGGAGRRGMAGPNEAITNTIVGVFTGVGALLFGTLIILGALRMKKLTSYGLAMTACILAMVPCVNCCLLGLPFGIWALTVLNKPEVKDAFE